MLTKSHRAFSLLASLRELKQLSEKDFEKNSQAFMTSYKKFIEKNPEDIYCISTKLTQSQTERADMLAEEIVRLSSSQSRVLFFLIQDTGKRNFLYKPYIHEVTTPAEDMWAEDFWPSNHPANLEFQKELEESALLGFHGFPKDFIKKLLEGELLNDGKVS